MEEAQELGNLSSAVSQCEISLEKHEKTPIRASWSIQDIKQFYEAHSSYYKYLLTSNRCLVQRTITQLENNNKDYYQPLIKSLIYLSQSFRDTHFASIPLEIRLKLQNIIKMELESGLTNMPPDQRQFYENALATNKQISQKTNYSWNIIKDLTIQKLYYIDAIAVLFKRNVGYLTKCKCKVKKNILPRFSRMFHLFGFQEQQIKKLYRVHRILIKHISQSMPRLNELFFIYQLIAVRNRICQFVRQVSTKFPFDQTENINMYKLLLFQDKLVYNSEQKRYRFCQLAFLTREKQLQSLNYNKRCNIVLQLIDLLNKNDQDKLQKHLLLIKVRQNLSFQVLTKFLNSIKGKQILQIQKLINICNQQTNKQFKKLFSVVFMRDYTIEQTIKKFKIEEKQKLTNFKKKHQYDYKIFTIFARNFTQFILKDAYIESLMLKMQQKLGNKFIIIKRKTFSFNYLKEINSNKTQAKNVKEDLFINLIIITDRSKILSFAIRRQLAQDSQYIQIVRNLLKKTQVKKPFIGIMFENKLGVQLEWRYFYRLIGYFMRQYNTRLYITCTARYNELILLTFSYIKMQLKKSAHLITRQNFYDLTEKIILKSLSLVSKSNHQYLLK